jgi:GH25 family lysozyme M1 (1,4-beta-N-acetylmuramidase)
MKVMDLSAWQSDVDWQAIKDEGIGGVILKLAEGKKLDAMFIEHVNNAVKYKLKYGVYYYAHACGDAEGRKEAEIVDRLLKTYLRGENPALGIWYDAEDDGMQKGDVTAACSAFVSTLNGKGYNYVGVYSSYNWLANGVIRIDLLADYVPYWVAQYYHENSLKLEKPHKNVKLWQYTDCYSDKLPYDCSIYYE